MEVSPLLLKLSSDEDFACEWQSSEAYFPGRCGWGDAVMCADGSQAVGQRPVLARCGRCHVLPFHSALLNYPLNDVPMNVSFLQLVPKVLSDVVLQGNVARLEVRYRQHPLPRHRFGQK